MHTDLIAAIGLDHADHATFYFDLIMTVWGRVNLILVQGKSGDDLTVLRDFHHLSLLAKEVEIKEKDRNPDQCNHNEYQNVAASDYFFQKRAPIKASAIKNANKTKFFTEDTKVVCLEGALTNRCKFCQ